MVDKLLIISWGVYPDQNGSGVIVHNLAKALGEKRVVVVGETPPNLKEWDNLNYPLFHINTNLLRIQKGIKYHKWMSFFNSFFKINKILKDHKCTKIIAVFPDEYFLWLSYFLAKLHKKELYPWFHNTYVENRIGMFKVLGKIIQPFILKYSTKVFCMSDGLTQYYKDHYKRINFFTLRHAFVLSPSENKIKEAPINRPFTFAYTGSLNESCRDASIRICRVISKKEHCKLIVFGKRNAEELIMAGISSDALQVYGFLHQDEYDRTLQSCDFMILAHGFRGSLSEVEYQTIFPTRTVPLLYSGKPIIAHVHPSSFLSTWLTDHSCAFVISTDKDEEISIEIDNFVSNPMNHKDLVFNAQKISNIFESKIIAKNLLELVN